ncbi:hypothetical protein KAS41_01345, partial [Candidatus Parcubacteria bacterium]|nr:hypothetical protein [Candidatus Parcubacteria bacterium]
SKWPSWQEELSEKLGTAVSIDPINRFSGDCDLAGYDSKTCWNETVKDFQCPNDSYLYQYSSLGVCSLHCDSETPSNSTFCAQNSDCPDAALGEYCIKSSAAAGISLRLESEADPMTYSFNMASLGPDPACASSEIYGTLALQNITCCEPMNCASLGYSCGTYTNSCNQSVNCGNCTPPEQCINGSCCVRNCAGKECGDDGCGSSCGVCDPGYSCGSSFTCVPSCTDGCTIKGETICSGTFSADGRQQINYCGYYDTDPCLEWPPNPEDCPWPYGCEGNICVCVDIDGDGFTNYLCGGDDCDDTDLNVNPDAEEICGNGIDDDCDGLIDNGNTDIDGDGYIDANCVGGDDCNDNDPNINPDAEEICDGIDNDCDGLTDNVDMDDDGYIDINCGGNDCDDRPNGADGISGTLDDGANINPGQPDDCTQYDGIDNDCDGSIDEHADTTEVLSNTDFETIDPVSGFPVSWSGGGQIWADVSVVNTDAHSGTNSLLLQQNPNLVYPGTCSQDLCESTGVYAANDRYRHSGRCTWLAGTSQCDFDDSLMCDWDGGQCIYNEGEHFDFFAYANRTMFLTFQYNVSNLAWEVGKMYITRFYYKGHSSGSFKPMMTYSLGHNAYCNEIASNWGSVNCAAGALNDGSGIPTCVDEPTHCCWSHPFQTRCYEYLPMGTVSAGDYPIWLEYSNTFVYTDEMNSHLDTIGNLRNVIGASMGYNSTDALGTDLYIDDFQILECNNRH